MPDDDALAASRLPAPGRPAQLLLVEDDDSDARLVEEMLDEGAPGRFDVVRATTLAAGVAHLNGASAACVLLDLSLPDAEGMEALVALRQVAPDAPILVFTAWEDDTAALLALQQGAQDYLIKGRMTPSALSRSVRYGMQRKRAELMRAVTRSGAGAGGAPRGGEAGQAAAERVATEGEYLKAAEVAELFHVSPKTIARWAEEGRIPFVTTLGGHRRFPRREIEEAIRQGTEN